MMLTPALTFTILMTAVLCAAATSPTFKDCPITTGNQQLGLDGIPYTKERADFYVCPPCTFIQLIATAPFRCQLGVILDVICSDGSSPTRADGSEFNPLGYTVFSSPPPTILVKSKNGFTSALLKSTVIPKDSMEPLGKGFVEQLDLVKVDGNVSTIGGVFPSAAECTANFKHTQRSNRVVCGPGSKLVGIRGDSRSGPVFNLDFLCAKVTSFQCA